MPSRLELMAQQMQQEGAFAGTRLERMARQMQRPRPSEEEIASIFGGLPDSNWQGMASEPQPIEPLAIPSTTTLVSPALPETFGPEIVDEARRTGQTPAQVQSRYFELLNPKYSSIGEAAADTAMRTAANVGGNVFDALTLTRNLAPQPDMAGMANDEGGVPFPTMAAPKPIPTIFEQAEREGADKAWEYGKKTEGFGQKAAQVVSGTAVALPAMGVLISKYGPVAGMALHGALTAGGEPEQQAIGAAKGAAFGGAMKAVNVIPGEGVIPALERTGAAMTYPVIEGVAESAITGQPVDVEGMISGAIMMGLLHGKGEAFRIFGRFAKTPQEAQHQQAQWGEAVKFAKANGRKADLLVIAQGIAPEQAGTTAKSVADFAKRFNLKYDPSAFAPARRTAGQMEPTGAMPPALRNLNQIASAKPSRAAFQKLGLDIPKQGDREAVVRGAREILQEAHGSPTIASEPVPPVQPPQGVENAQEAQETPVAPPSGLGVEGMRQNIGPDFLAQAFQNVTRQGPQRVQEQGNLQERLLKAAERRLAPGKRIAEAPAEPTVPPPSTQSAVGAVPEVSPELPSVASDQEPSKKAAPAPSPQSQVQWQDITDIPRYDDAASNPDYFREKKGIIASKTLMKPHEYLKKSADELGVSLEEFIRGASDELVEKYAAAMRRGDRFPMLSIEYGKQNQEGRNRALAAQQIGVKQVPVLEVRHLTPAPSPQPESKVKEPWEMTAADIDAKYPAARDTVDGRMVGNEIRNESSIEASLDNYTILKGVREVSFSMFENAEPPVFTQPREEARTRALAAEIEASGRIDPLIVVDDGQSSLYVLEGGHRFDALLLMGAKSFPAVVVVDEDAYATATKQAHSEGKPVPASVLAEYGLDKKAKAPGRVEKPSPAAPGKAFGVSESEPVSGVPGEQTKMFEGRQRKMFNPKAPGKVQPKAEAPSTKPIFGETNKQANIPELKAQAETFPKIPEAKMNTESAQVEYDAMRKKANRKGIKKADYDALVSKLKEMQRTGEIVGQEELFADDRPLSKDEEASLPDDADSFDPGSFQIGRALQSAVADGTTTEKVARRIKEASKLLDKYGVKHTLEISGESQTADVTKPAIRTALAKSLRITEAELEKEIENGEEYLIYGATIPVHGSSQEQTIRYFHGHNERTVGHETAHALQNAGRFGQIDETNRAWDTMETFGPEAHADAIADIWNTQGEEAVESLIVPAGEESTIEQLQRAVDVVQRYLWDTGRRDQAASEDAILNEMRRLSPSLTGDITIHTHPWGQGLKVTYKGKPYAIRRANRISNTFDIQPHNQPWAKQITDVRAEDIVWPETPVFQAARKPKAPGKRIDRIEAQIKNLEGRVGSGGTLPSMAKLKAKLAELKALKDKPKVRVIPKAVMQDVQQASTTELIRRVQRSPSATKEMKKMASDLEAAGKELVAIEKAIKADADFQAYKDIKQTVGQRKILTALKKHPIAYGTHIHMGGEIALELEGQPQSVRQYFKKLTPKEGYGRPGQYSALDDMLKRGPEDFEIPLFETPSELLDYIMAAIRASKGARTFEDQLANAVEMEAERYGDELPEGETLPLADLDRRMDEAAATYRSLEKELTEKFSESLGEDVSLIGAGADDVVSDIQKTISDIEAASESLADAEKEAGKEAVAMLKDRLAALKAAESDKMEAGPIRQKIKAIVAEKGLSQKELRDIIRKHAGRTQKVKGEELIFAPDSIGRIADRPTLVEIMKSVLKARPKQRNGQRVITIKTERKIQDMKAHFIATGQLTEEGWAKHLQILRGKVPAYVNANTYATEQEAHKLIRAVLDEAPVVRMRLAREKAFAKDAKIGTLAQEYDPKPKSVLPGDKQSQAKLFGGKDIRYYFHDMETKAGVEGVFDVVSAFINERNQIQRDVHKDFSKLVEVVGQRQFLDLMQDAEADKRIIAYIEAQAEESPSPVEGLTKTEEAIANRLIDIFTNYAPKSTIGKFAWLYDMYGEQMIHHREEMLPDAPKEELQRAFDLLETRGYDAAYKYLETVPWGKIKKGYAPRDFLHGLTTLRRMAPTSYTKGHIKVREGEHTMGDRTLLQRVGNYMHQMQALVRLQPYARSVGRLVDEATARGAFEKPERVQADVAQWMQEMRGYSPPLGEIGEWVRRLQSDFITVRLAMPDKWLRNKMQPMAFYPDRVDLFAALREKFTAGDDEYIATHVSQETPLARDLMFQVDKPRLFGIIPSAPYAKLMELVRLYSPYGWTDATNRTWVFRAKSLRAKRAFDAYGRTGDAKALARALRLDDLAPMQAREVLQKIAEGDMDGARQRLGRFISEDTQWLYDRALRAPWEQGPVARLILNLFTFARSYGQRLIGNTRRVFAPGASVNRRWRGVKWTVGMVVVGTVLGEIYKRVTGRKRNPYAPQNVMLYSPEGAGTAIIEPGEKVVRHALDALAAEDDKKRRQSLDAMGIALLELGDLAIPTYEAVMNTLEGVIDRQYFDREMMRYLETKAFPDYKPREDYYPANRTVLERIQKLLFFTEPQQKREKAQSTQSKAPGKKKQPYSSL